MDLTLSKMFHLQICALWNLLSLVVTEEVWSDGITLSRIKNQTASLMTTKSQSHHKAKPSQVYLTRQSYFFQATPLCKVARSARRAAVILIDHKGTMGLY